MRIGITGATGFIGGWVARTALAGGHEVTAFARDAGRLDPDIRARVAVSTVGLMDADALPRPLEQLDVLIHAAAIFAYGRDAGDRMVAENPALVRSVLASARAAGVPHVIDVSSGVVFRPHAAGDRQGAVDIASPLWDASDRGWGDPYLRSKVLAELEARGARNAGQPISSIHPTLAIGPRDRVPGPSGSTLLAILRGPVVPDSRLPWVDVRDVADGVLEAAARPPGGRYLLSVGAVRFRSIARALDRLTGRPRRRLFLPRSAVRLTARLNEASGARLRPELPAPAALEFLLAAHPVDGSTGAELLGGYRRLADTLVDTLRWWSDNGIVSSDEVGRIARTTAPPSPGS